MNNYQREQLENIRRSAESLAKIADEYNSAVDVCNHIINLVDLIQTEERVLQYSY